MSKIQLNNVLNVASLIVIESKYSHELDTCQSAPEGVSVTTTHSYKIESRNLDLHFVYQIVIRSLE